jgi:hypothetical protein
MRVLLGIALFIFLAPLCCGIGLLGGCIASLATPNAEQGLFIAGPLIGLATSVVLAVLITRSLRLGET